MPTLPRMSQPGLGRRLEGPESWPEAGGPAQVQAGHSGDQGRQAIGMGGRGAVASGRLCAWQPLEDERHPDCSLHPRKVRQQ